MLLSDLAVQTRLDKAQIQQLILLITWIGGPVPKECAS